MIKICLKLNYDALAMANFDSTIVKVPNTVPDVWDWRDYGRISPVKDHTGLSQQLLI